MALLHWRKFSFFDEENVANTEVNQLLSVERPKDLPDDGRLFIPVKITCSSSGRVHVILGDNKGFVYIVDRNLKIVDSFKAHQGFVSHIKQSSSSPIFITCGLTDEESINPLIKFWNSEKYDHLDQPTCIRTIKACAGLPQNSNITCLECNDSLTLMLVGFKDGTIVVYFGDLKSSKKPRASKTIKVTDSEITGLFLREEMVTKQKSPQINSIQGLFNQNWGTSSKVTAFMSTSNEIYYLNIDEKSFKETRLDSLGCSLKCSCLIEGQDKKQFDSLFAVARDNAVYFYQVDGRGPCLAFDGEKLAICRLNRYLVMLSRDKQTQLESLSYNRNIRKTQAPDFDMRKVNLNIYDVHNKFIAHSSSIPEIQSVFSAWSQLYIVCKDGQVITFKEKDTQTKLETLFRKNQFGLVIDIAKSHQYDEDALADIFRHYADSLYDKGDYDGAISQYIKTIGHFEPSYVIKKFMNSQRLNNLTVYLEALHKRSYANQEHTKLLLNCYSKLKNDQQLKQFIESFEEGNISFDVEIAIKVLRNACFYEFAIYLAKKYKHHELFFIIQMQDINDSFSALEYMNEMDDVKEAAYYLKKYGRTMLHDEPSKTIEMIKSVCLKSRNLPFLDISKNSKVDELALIASSSISSKFIYPEEFFHLFVDKNELFVQLLEQLVNDKSDFATKTVYTLLLELYLSSWASEPDAIMKVPICEKIKKLLNLPNEKYDIEQASILCKNNGYNEGLLHLYSRLSLHDLVLDYYIDQDDALKVMKTCEQFGDNNPKLYVRAIKYFSKKNDDFLGQILKVIEHQNILPPITVISLLIEQQSTALKSVREYLVRVLNHLRDKILDNRNEIDHYKDDTESIRAKIEEFENHSTVFKPSICSACKGDLNLPTVHFLCTHSYHQSCFYNYSSESEECPICMVDNKNLLKEIASLEVIRSDSTKLAKRLGSIHPISTAEDSFNVLAKFFGYGVL